MLNFFFLRRSLLFALGVGVFSASGAAFRRTPIVQQQQQQQQYGVIGERNGV